MSDTTTTPQPVSFAIGQIVYAAHEYTGEILRHIVADFNGTDVRFLCDSGSYHKSCVSATPTDDRAFTCESCRSVQEHGPAPKRTMTAAAAGPALMALLPERDYEPLDDFPDCWLAADLVRSGIGTVRIVIADDITVYAFDAGMACRYSATFTPDTAESVVVAALDQIEREALGLGHVYTVVVSDETGRSVYSNKTRAVSVYRALGFAWSCTTE